MNNSTLFFRSLAIVIFLTGFAHIFSHAENEPTKQMMNKPKSSVPIKETDNQTPSSPEENPKLAEKTSIDEKISAIIGRWKVAYNNEDFEGSIVYTIKKEGGNFNAYTYQYEDKNGYTEKAEGAKTLLINDFDGKKGKGIYMLEYEGSTYEVDCAIEMIDKKTFKLSYDYYGYSDIETWKSV